MKFKIPFHSHISSAQMPHMAAGYHIGEYKCGTFQLLQKVPLDSDGLIVSLVQAGNVNLFPCNQHSAWPAEEEGEKERGGMVVVNVVTLPISLIELLLCAPDCAIICICIISLNIHITQNLILTLLHKQGK